MVIIVVGCGMLAVDTSPGGEGGALDALEVGLRVVRLWGADGWMPRLRAEGRRKP